MSKPFVSICIPTYKRTDLLAKLLDSIKSQTFTDVEILINDNSPDDSVQQLISTYSTLLPISYIKNEPAVSAANNCINVMQRANAEWIKVMHDDDWFATDTALQTFVDAAKQSGKEFIFSASNQVWLDGEKKSEKDELLPWKKEMLDDSFFCLFYLNVIGHPSVAMHKKDTSITYDASFNWVLDIDFYMRYFSKHPGYFYIPDALVNIGKGSTQESNKYYKNINVELPEYFRLLAKYDKGLAARNKNVFHLVWNMVKRYKIKDPSQIYAVGYQGPMPDGIEEIIAFQKRIPRIILKQPPWSKKLMSKCFDKLKAKG